MKIGDILVHRLSGTFSEVVYSNFGFSLSFSMRYGGKTSVSRTISYSEESILKQWRYATTDEIEMFNRGKLSIK